MKESEREMRASMVLESPGTVGFPGRLSSNLGGSQRVQTEQLSVALVAAVTCAPAPTGQQLGCGRSLWHPDPRSLRDLCFLVQNAFEIVCDSGAAAPVII